MLSCVFVLLQSLGTAQLVRTIVVMYVRCVINVEPTKNIFQTFELPAFNSIINSYVFALFSTKLFSICDFS